MVKDCIFCKIAYKEIFSDVRYEDDKIIAFNDIKPIAPVHILIIPKKHIANINDLSENDSKLIGDMILVARKLAKENNIAENGYKLLFRVGRDGGQEVEHIHLHLIGGAKLHEEIYPEA